MWLEPDAVCSIYRARGITQSWVDASPFLRSIEEAEAVIRFRVAQRAKRFQRRGRPKASDLRRYHVEWATQADFWRAELGRRYSERLELGLLEPADHPPTDSDALPCCR